MSVKQILATSFHPLNVYNLAKTELNNGVDCLTFNFKAVDTLSSKQSQAPRAQIRRRDFWYRSNFRCTAAVTQKSSSGFSDSPRPGAQPRPPYRPTHPGFDFRKNRWFTSLKFLLSRGGAGKSSTFLHPSRLPGNFINARRECRRGDQDVMACLEFSRSLSVGREKN